jgi:hypothetical protein
MPRRQASCIRRGMNTQSPTVEILKAAGHHIDRRPFFSLHFLPGNLMGHTGYKRSFQKKTIKLNL